MDGHGTPVVTGTARRIIAPRPGPVEGHPSTKDRLVVLDGLRFVAALSVVLHHYTFAGGQFWPDGGFPSMAEVFRYGLCGINLFFLISGFVICMSSWGRGLGAFFVSRVGRLFPAYWCAVVLTIAVMLIAGRNAIEPNSLLANLTMMQDGMGAPSVDGSYWTLWRELLFYLLFAVVVWRGVNYRRVLIFCVLWTVASVVVAGAPESLLAQLVDIDYSMYFIAGVAMYLMYRFRPTVLLWGIVVLSWVLALFRLGHDLAQRDLRAPAEHWWIGAAVVTACFLVLLATALGWLNAVRGRWLTLLGALTYPLYLIHQVIGYQIIRALAGHVNRYALLVALVVVMLLAAWLIHRLVERPLAPILRQRLRTALADARQAEPNRAMMSP